MIKYLGSTFLILSFVVATNQSFAQQAARTVSNPRNLSLVEGDSCVALIRTLSTEYKVVDLMVGAISTVDVESFRRTSVGHSFDQSWRATLLPQYDGRRVRFDCFFPYTDGGVTDTSQALKGLRKYYNSVMAVPWVDSLLSQDSSVTIAIKYVAGRSLSIKALSSFVACLSRHTWKAEDLIQEVLQDARQIVFIDLQESFRKYSRWLVLPNGDSILWHYYDYGVLDLDVDQFQHTQMFGATQLFVRFDSHLQVVDAP